MRKAREFTSGIFILFGSHAIASAAVMLFGSIFFENYAYIGFIYGWLAYMHCWQIFYALPLLLWLAEKRRKRYAARGVATGAVITFAVWTYLWIIHTSY